MKKTAHESQAKVMSAAEVWHDAQQLADLLRSNLLRSEPVVRLQIPFTSFLSAVESFDRDELVMLRERVEERLAA